MCHLVDLVASHCGVINQWHIIFICLQALKKRKPSDWIVSFKTVNMHPKQRVKFSDWLIKISFVLQTTDAAFKTKLYCATIFDAMTAFWKACMPDLIQEVVYAINQLFAGCLPDEYVFGCKHHLMELTKFVPIDKMKQLRVVCMASKREPSLITMRNEYLISQAASVEVIANNQRPKESELLSVQMMPKTLLNTAIQKDPPDQQAREKLS